MVRARLHVVAQVAAGSLPTAASTQSSRGLLQPCIQACMLPSARCSSSVAAAQATDADPEVQQAAQQLGLGNVPLDALRSECQGRLRCTAS
jgi:hypothetical protein